MQSEQANEEFVRKNLPWNFSVNLADILLITMGLSLVSRETVMPVLVSQLTDSKFAIGLIPAIYSLGFYLPQLFSANLSEQMRYKKPFVMQWGGLGERVPYGIMAVALWWLALSSPTTALIIFFLLLGITASSTGFATPAWFDMIAKVIPVQRRGLWSGMGHGLGALFGAIVAYFITGQILESYAYPNNFALLFGLAFAAATLSWIGLALNREPPSLHIKKEIPLRRYLSQLPIVLRENTNYTRFILSRTIIHMGAMASGFFMVYGTQEFAISGIEVGYLTGALIASKAVSNLLWGLIGDKWGHKLVLSCAAFAVALATLAAWNASSFLWLVVVFILLGAYMAADEVSGLNIILEFCASEDRPTYIGLTNTLLAPAVTIAPIIGGALATWLDYSSMFAIALIIATAGGLLLTYWVHEPRGDEGMKG